MSSRWRDRLRQTFGLRIAWWYAVLFLASSLTLVGITYILLGATLRQHDREIIESTLVSFASAWARGGPDALAREIQRAQMTGPAGPLFVRVVGRRQDLVFVSMPERWQEFDLAQLASPSLSGEQSWAMLETGRDGDDALEVLSVRLPDGVLFQVGKSTERRATLLRRFRTVLLFNLASIVAVGLAGGAVLTWTALRPVRALAATMNRIMSTGETAARVPVQPDGDAMTDLTRQVNAMLDRIDAVVGGMRGALDNVAHDLRTPMARLRSTAESALDSHDPERLRAALADCVEESDQIIGMLSTLMDISEAETGTMALRLERIPVAELVAQTAALYEDVAEEAGLTFETRVADGLFVDGDRGRLRQALANLVDNAIKYTPRGGAVAVRALGEDGWVRIEVQDSGLGIPADELPHIWDRLYRGDKSRSSRGLGLGLSLVRAIVAAHNGTVSVESTPGQGSRFDVRLPSAELRGELDLRASS